MQIQVVEGKNRQVRKMTAAIGHPTLRLIRQSIANLELGDLRAGEWRSIERADIQWGDSMPAGEARRSAAAPALHKKTSPVVSARRPGAWFNKKK